MKLKLLSLLVTLGMLVAPQSAIATAQAGAMPPPNLYEGQSHKEDLVVKVPGGRVVVNRTIYGGHLHSNFEWRSLGWDVPLLADRESIIPTVIYHGPNEYKRVSDGVYRFLRRYTIERSASGYRWTDRKGNWKEYNRSGAITAYGDKNNTVATFQYNSDALIQGVFDNRGNQVLWFTYGETSPLNRTRPLLSIHDRDARRIQYSISSTADVPRMIGVTDAEGNASTFNFGSNRAGFRSGGFYYFGQMSYTDAEGRTVKTTGCFGLLWDGLDQDNIGSTIKCGYDKYKKLYYIQAKTAGGRIDQSWNNNEGVRVRWEVNGNLLQTVSAEGRRRVISDRSGNKTILDYDEWDNIVRKTYPDGKSVSYVYDPKHSGITREVDENGVVTERTFDAKGNVLKETFAVGKPDQRVVDYTYYPNGTVETTTLRGDASTPDAVYRYEYDANDNVTVVTDPENNVRRFTHDIAGNLLTATDARGKVWSYTYDKNGRLLTETDPLLNTVSYGYDRVGNQTRFTDANNKTWQLRYNKQHRLTEIVDPYQKIDRIEYNADGLVVKEIDAEGTTTSYEYDLTGRLTKTIDGNGNVSTQSFADGPNAGIGSFAQAVRVDYPTFAQLYQYDQRDRMTMNTTLVGADGRVSSFGYDGAGNVVTETNPEGKTAFYEYDSFNDLRKYINRNGAAAEFATDRRANTVSFKDFRGELYRFDYDRADRLKKETRPLGQAFSYSYDAEGNLTDAIDAKGQKISYRYDDAGRLDRISHFAASADLTPSSTVNIGRDKAGNITSWSDGTHSGTLQYDDVGRLLGETINYGAFSLSYSYTYRDNSQKKSFTGPDGITYNYTYGTNAELTGIQYPAGTITFGQYLWNAPRSVTLPGGMVRSLELDAFLNPTAVSVKDPGQNVVATIQTTYGKALQVTEKTIDGVKTVYAYDDEYRLTGATAPSKSETFALDPAGNITADAQGSRALNANNQMTTSPVAAYQYDSNGNLTQKSQGANVTYYYYDTQNRLTRIEDTNHTVIARYGYDPFDRRLWKEVDNTKTYYLHTDEGLTGEYDATGNQTRSYGYTPDTDWGTDPLFTNIANTYYYYHNDHLSTPIKLTAPDGTLVWSADYNAYGKATVSAASTVANNLRFPGHYHDAESQLHYNGRRYYDPEIGRYLTEDPIGLTGGSNLYRYADADPVNVYDNTGECGLIGAARNVALGLLLSGGCFSWGDALTDAALGALCLPRLPKFKPPKRQPKPEPPQPDVCPIANSFTAETLVHTKEGPRPIAAIAIGDEVLSFAEWNNAQSYQKVEDVRVSEKTQTIVRLTLNTGDTIEATEGHPFYVEGQGWRDARLLKAGDTLKHKDQTLVTIQALDTEQRQVKVYNLEVANSHTFYVGEQGMLAHNGYGAYVITYQDGSVYVGKGDRRRMMRSARRVAKATNKGLGCVEFYDATNDYDSFILEDMLLEAHGGPRGQNPLTKALNKIHSPGYKHRQRQ